jgi:hypothetical protein
MLIATSTSTSAVMARSASREVVERYLPAITLARTPGRSCKYLQAVLTDVAEPQEHGDYRTTWRSLNARIIFLMSVVPVHRYDTYCRPIFSAKLTFETAVKVA